MKFNFDIFRIKSSDIFDEKLKVLELEELYYKNYLNHLEISQKKLTNNTND